MKYYRDLLFVLILAIISEIWFLVPVLRGYPLSLVPYGPLILALPGYALLASIKPLCYKEPNLYKGIFTVNFSILITIATVLLVSSDIPLYIILAFITIFLTVTAFVRRMLTKSPEEDEQPEKQQEPDAVGIPEEERIPDAELAVSVENVSMKFNLSQEVVDNLKEYVIKLLKRELFFQEFWALKDITFQVKKGEKVGIIGLNGAGKSTLLKLISGVMKPTTGTIKVNGSIAPLLELGGGFDPNYTGRENIYLRGALLGYSKEFIESKFDEIVEFAELEEFIDVPIKNYSSGMKSRLGFSISTMVQPQILILDEVLAAGDAKFRKKSQDRMNSMLNEKTTVILVSHSMAQIRNLCTRALWLEDGRLVMDGPSKEVTESYLKSIEEGR